MNDRAYYNQYWSETGFNPDEASLPVELRLILEESVSVGRRTLDLGCGAGSKMEKPVKALDLEYTGVDVSETAIAAAKTRGLHALLVEDTSALPFADGEFDLIVSFEVMEHVFDPAAILTEAYRVLRSGGRIVISVPNVGFIRQRVRLMRGVWDPFGDDMSIEKPWRDPHIRFFTSDSLERLMSEVGFAEVLVGGHFDSRARPRRSFNGIVTRSKVYSTLQRKNPGLFGVRLHAVARKLE